MNTTNIETFEQFKDFVLERESYMKQLLEKVSEHENSYKSQIPKYCFSYTRKSVDIILYINTRVIDNSEISNFRISFFKNYFSRLEDNLPDVKKKLLCKSKKKSDEVKPRSVYKKNSNLNIK